MKQIAVIVALLLALPVLAGERKVKKPAKPLTYAEQQQANREAIAAKNLKKRQTAEAKAEREFDRRMEAARKPRVDKWNPLASGPKSITAGS